VILARFVPMSAPFVRRVAGAAKMPYSRYLLFDICGGHFLGGAAWFWGAMCWVRGFPTIGKYLHLVIGTIILLSILPPIIGLIRARRSEGH